MMRFNFFLLLLVVLCMSCQDKEKTPEQNRTSGSITVLVDETFARILDPQIEVFKSDYPNSSFTQILGNEGKIVPTFLNDSVRFIILSRMLTSDEEKYYKRRKIPVNTDRFAIDGVALITHKGNIDSNITVKEVIDIFQGKGETNKVLVFDNPYSSTIRYFKDLAKVNTIPSKGIASLNNSEEVIKYVAKNKGTIGIVGVNWLFDYNVKMPDEMGKIMLMNVKNLPGKEGSENYLKPTHDNLMNGIYPFLRNVYVINAEGKNGLGTGFATWLTSPRGQLIVDRSGLAPHKMPTRDINFKSKY